MEKDTKEEEYRYGKQFENIGLAKSHELKRSPAGRILSNNYGESNEGGWESALS